MEYPTLEGPETVAIPALHTHTATVIFLHGLGQSHLTWRMMISEAIAPKLPNVEWILPQAPRRHVSLNRGHHQPSWFDIARIPPYPDEFDEFGMVESIKMIENIILSQVHNGIDSRRIILMGFSQGAALALMVSLTTLHYLGGVASLSGWIPPPARTQILPVATSLPVLWCHGAADMEIPISYAQDAVKFLRHSVGISQAKLQLRVYNSLAHNINDSELADITSWLNSILGVDALCNL